MSDLFGSLFGARVLGVARGDAILIWILGSPFSFISGSVSVYPRRYGGEAFEKEGTGHYC